MDGQAAERDEGEEEEEGTLAALWSAVSWRPWGADDDGDSDDVTTTSPGAGDGSDEDETVGRLEVDKDGNTVLVQVAVAEEIDANSDDDDDDDDDGGEWSSRLFARAYVRAWVCDWDALNCSSCKLMPVLFQARPHLPSGSHRFTSSGPVLPARFASRSAGIVVCACVCACAHVCVCVRVCACVV